MRSDSSIDADRHAAPAVVVTSRSFGSGRTDPASELMHAGLSPVRARPDHDLGELRPVLGRAVGWIAGTGPITAEHLDAAPHLRVIARYGTGVDALDLNAAAEHRVVVTNTPGANSEAVADFALALMLEASRGVTSGARAARESRAAQATPRPGRELGAMRVGLVGFGAIGQAVCRRLRGFGSQVLAHDPYVSAQTFGEREAGRAPDLETLFDSSDLVSLHRPGSGGGAVVGSALLNRLPHGAILINTARADLMDENDVAAALHEGTLGAVGIDVLAGGNSPLLGAPNVVATPHMAAQTQDAIDRMGTSAVAEVLRVLGGARPLHPVAREQE